jgi:hypothetical protein
MDWRMSTASGIGDATNAPRVFDVRSVLTSALLALPLLGVDSAAISLIDDGVSRGTFGSSDQAAKLLDELQFTCGEGPCLEAARTMAPVFAPDLQSRDEPRWPVFQDAAERAGIRAVFAIPIRVGKVSLGALDLFRRTPGPLSAAQATDAIVVADAAAQALLDATDEGSGDGADPGEQWEQLASMARVDVYQAAGMVMAQLDVSPAEALSRLRAYAFANQQTASEVAQLVLTGSLHLEPWTDAH